ncbi:DUF2169 family type VI secretion system accessory protein [Pigmentiphaga soli]|uniref:DUF2169 family type VI secretion system accessory protein n=1 Tax=Pigmentiphaga soli TaxID=1007095 RepID=UPI0031EC014F
MLKPLTLGVGTRSLEWRRRFGMAVTVSCYFSYAGPGAATLRTDVSMWSMLAREMAMPLIDEGFPKRTPEFLVWGAACPPEGPATACAVRARVGRLEKRLVVSGDRYWDGDRISAPQPFHFMPLDWHHAYGGPDFAANPLGRGRAPDAKGVVWLPNVELPQARLTARRQAPPPAAFGYVDPAWPQRASLRGTYDENWYREHSPGLAPDVDWRHFNLAPQDQWFDAPLRGDEDFEFEHMHLHKPLVSGRLPGLRARCFMQLRDGTRREAPLAPTTIWFLPHLECGILLFHGMIETRSEDGEEIDVLMAACERLDEPRSDAHYHEVMSKRLHPQAGHIYALRDSDLVPAGMLGADPDFESAQQDYAPAGLRADAQVRKVQLQVERVRQRLRLQGVDPDKIGVRVPEREKPPSLDELPDYLERQLAAAAEQQKAAAAESVQMMRRARAQADALGVDPATLGHRGPPDFKADEYLARIRQAAAVAGKPVDNLPALQAKLKQAQAVARLNYLCTAHAQPPAPPMDPARAARARAEVQRRLAAGESLAAVDLTGADLSGLDLRGADFSAAHLESADLSRANLSGADFCMAVLAHANLEGAVAIGTLFMGANLAKARLAGAVFDRANLDRAVMMQTQWLDLSLRGAVLTGIQWFESAFAPADWSGATADGQTFLKADLKQMLWEGVRMRQATFIECDLSGIDLRGADLAEASFVGCKGQGAQCAGANLERVAFAQGCDFSGAVFTGARLPRANLRGARLAGCDFGGAVLDGADLSEAALAGAALPRASLRGSLLVKTDLRDARAGGVNLKDAILQRALLTGADLRHANLYGSDLSRVAVDDATLLEGALADRARLHPRLPPGRAAEEGAS